MKVYTKKELKRPSFFQKIFGVKLKENGIIEINNLLADRGLLLVKVDDIQTITADYKINLKTKFRLHICDIYTQYLTHCLSDKHLSDRELDDLKHLKQIFNLSDQEIDKIHKDVSGKIYKKEVDKAVEDGKLEKSERDFLSKLQKDIKLSDEFTNEIYKESATALVQRFIDDAVSDERLSPDEEKQLAAISNSLNINFQFDEPTHVLLDKYKLFWQIENGEIPTIDPGINIQKSEECYFRTHCNWLEQRRVTKRIRYGGPTMRIKIAKGLYWRAGDLAIQPVAEDVWATIDSGDLYLTNKRLIFMGSKGNKTIRLNKVLDFTTYSNGVDIQKDTGKSPFLQFSNNTDIFTMILGRAISEL